MLTITNLTKAFGPRVLWSGLDLAVEPGHLVALTGASGSGKTTLLNCVGALERPTGGTIRWKDHDITKAGSRERQRLRKAELGYLFQNYALVERATIAQNISYAVAGPWPWVRASYDRELSMVGLAGREREPVYQLSGGEQQRVALARIIAKKPGLILADEPTGALDADNGAAVVRILRSLADDGAVVVIATHNPDVTAACDSVLHLTPTAQPVRIS